MSIKQSVYSTGNLWTSLNYTLSRWENMSCSWPSETFKRPNLALYFLIPSFRMHCLHRFRSSWELVGPSEKIGPSPGGHLNFSTTETLWSPEVESWKMLKHLETKFTHRHVHPIQVSVPNHSPTNLTIHRLDFRPQNIYLRIYSTVCSQEPSTWSLYIWNILKVGWGSNQKPTAMVQGFTVGHFEAIWDLWKLTPMLKPGSSQSFRKSAVDPVSQETKASKKNRTSDQLNKTILFESQQAFRKSYCFLFWLIHQNVQKSWRQTFPI